MKKLLGIPNDPTTSYFRSNENDFLGEFNPQKEGKRVFDQVSLLNWRDEKKVKYFGVESYPIIPKKDSANELYNKLTNCEISFDDPAASFKEIFEKSEEEIKSIVKKYNPTLIRAFNTHFAVEVGIISRKYVNSPLIVSAHDPTRLSPAITQVDQLICESYELKNLCMEKFGVNESKIKVIHNGIDGKFFSPKKDFSKVISEEYLNAPYKVFSSSRIVKGKNIETLLKAINFARDELPGLIHLHVGSETAQPEKVNEVKQLRQELGLENISHFLGPKPKEELPFYYSWADTFILPTLWEGLSRVMRESLSCGTPVIATNYGSSSEIIQNGYNGISIDPTNEEEIAEAMITFFKNPLLKRGLTKNARESSKKYGLEKSMNLYSQMYSELLK